MGTESERVIVDNDSHSTSESAKWCRQIINDKTFGLITSAGHMLRAMGTFMKSFLEPIPFPTDFLTRKNILSQSYLPTPGNLKLIDLAFHEYVAIFYYNSRGYM